MDVDILGEDLWGDNENKTDHNKAKGYHETQLVIQIPFEYHDKNGEEHEVAHWGGANMPWSGTLAEFVYYYDKNLCHHVVETNETALPFYPNKVDHDQQIHPFILMAPPGPCSPVTWARRAQYVGAAALMVADNVCRCEEKKCTDKYGAANCRQEGTPILINDGTAGDVTIPVWVVTKTVGENLKKSVMQDSQPVLVEYSWGLPITNETERHESAAQQNKTITYHLWTAAAHDPQMTPDAVQELQKVVKVLADHLILKPKFRLLDGTHFNCPSFSNVDKSPCDHLCTNGGRYCAVHQSNLSGHAVVREALRRICIWKHYGSNEYWDYWVHHTTVCHTPHLYADNDCVKEGLHQANIDPTIIDQCMIESGDVESTDSNTFLESMLEEQRVSGVVRLPAITHAETNAVLDHGASAHSLFESVCYHYYWRAQSTNLHWDDVPDLCGTCFQCTNLMGCLEHGKCVPFDHHDHGNNDNGNKPKPPSGSEGGKHRHRGLWRFFWFLVVVGLGGYGYYYYKQQQQGMYNGGGLLGGYLQLSGNDN